MTINKEIKEDKKVIDLHRLLLQKYLGKHVKMLTDGWSDYGNGKDTQDFWAGDTGTIIGIYPMHEDYSYAWEIRFDDHSLWKHERLVTSTSTFWHEFKMINEIHPMIFLKEHQSNNEPRLIDLRYD